MGLVKEQEYIVENIPDFDTFLDVLDISKTFVNHRKYNFTPTAFTGGNSFPVRMFFTYGQLWQGWVNINKKLRKAEEDAIIIQCDYFLDKSPTQFKLAQTN
jgi:hypothetical protein